MPEFADSSRARAESTAERHSRWTWIHETAAMTGWNFTALEGRLIADDPPWDFDTMCLDAIEDADEVLDMGTGGGERLISIVKRFRGRNAASVPDVAIHASEGWAPNVPVATSALEDYGIDVTEYDSESGDPMPWEDGQFDVVMNRHESYDIAEVARILAPGGLFLTQQVDSTEAEEFRRWFGGTPENPEVQLERCVDEVEAQGLTVEAARRWMGTMRFTDVEAVIEYLAYVPWDVPGFVVGDHIGALERLAAERRPIEVTQKRFLIAAVKE